MYYKKDFGNEGEQSACDYLINIGYSVLNRNFISKIGEIDIICLDNTIIKPEIVFIEVKTRYDKKYGNPAEAVNKAKIRHIIKTAEYYLLINKLENMNVRFDVIEIIIKHNMLFNLNHIKNAFDYSDIYY